MPTLVLIRHGQSAWNLENRFTGWWDVDLTEQGVQEATDAGTLMKDKGLDFDLRFTSFQSRAIKTLHLALEAMGRLWLPEEGSPWDLSKDTRYHGVPIPQTESLKDTIARVLPYWEERIAPELKAGKRVLISAHGNSLRALVKHLSGISDNEIASLEIPTGQPIVYELDDQLNATDRYYLNER